MVGCTAQPIYLNFRLLEMLITVADTQRQGESADDGSSDRSLDIIRGLNRKDPRVKCVSFSRNFGHQLAISAGMRQAAGPNNGP